MKSSNFNIYYENIESNFLHNLCVEKVVLRHYKKGELVAEKGRIARYLGYIKSRFIKYVVSAPDGIETRINRLINIFVALICFIFCDNIYAQSANEIIASDVNTGQWFALERHLAEFPTDSVSPFMRLIGRAFASTKFNHPEESVAAFEELLNNHSESLGLSNLLMMSHFMANDLSKIGRNAEAAELINDIVNATRQHLDSITIESFSNFAKQYEAFSYFSMNEIVLPDKETPCIEFDLDSINTGDSNSCYMKLRNSSLNGKPLAFTFDTGAGVNIISDSLAVEYSIKPLDASVSAMGMDFQDGWLGLANEIKIGNILIKNVPFYVITIATGNEEIDKYAKHLNMLLGVQVMQVLKDFTIDFTAGEITVASHPTSHSRIVPNMCYSNSLQLIGNFNNGDIQAIIDTGDAEYCSLAKKYYIRHEDEIKAHGTPDTERTGGAGGIRVTEGYNLSDFQLTLNDHTVILPEVYVSEDYQQESDGIIGIDALCLFKRLHFNMNDMTLIVE